jgi:hypothetical protein
LHSDPLRRINTSQGATNAARAPQRGAGEGGGQRCAPPRKSNGPYHAALDREGDGGIICRDARAGQISGFDFLRCLTQCIASYPLPVRQASALPGARKKPERQSRSGDFLNREARMATIRRGPVCQPTKAFSTT